jgi:anti-sigma factor RsiW
MQKRLGAYLDGELDPVARRRIEDHLAECGRCTAELAALKSIEEAYRHDVEMPREEEFQALWGRIAPRLAGGVQEETISWRKRIAYLWEAFTPRRMAIASLAAACIIVALAVLSVTQSEVAEEGIYPLAASGDVIQSEVELDSASYTPLYVQRDEGVGFVILIEKAEEQDDSGLI